MEDGAAGLLVEKIYNVQMFLEEALLSCLPFLEGLTTLGGSSSSKSI